MNVYTIPLGKTLVDLREKVAEVSGRPAFISQGARYEGRDTLYRGPHEDEYRAYRPLELYLSGLASDCAGIREDASGRIRLFDLTPVAKYFCHIVVPALPKDLWTWPGERASQWKNPLWFTEAGVPSNLGSGWDRVPCTAEEAGPVLAPFIREWPPVKPGGLPMTGLCFHSSGDIALPNFRHETWFQDGETRLDKDTVISPMCPPGQYYGKHGVLTEYNTFGLAHMRVGSCVVCRGASGDAVHLATMSTTGSGIYPMSPVCRKCASGVFQQWQALMDGWSPTI